MMTKKTPSTREEFDAMWRAVKESPLAGIYINELYWLAVRVCGRAEHIFDAAPPGLVTDNYVTVDFDLGDEMYALLSETGRIRQLLTDRGKNGKETRTQYEMRKRRILWLRDEILGGIKLVETRNSDVRNTLEHFDEAIDHVSANFAEKAWPVPALLPWDVIVSKRGVVLAPTVWWLRTYLADEEVFVNCGQEIDVRAVHRECGDIRDRIAAVAPPGDIGERGGSITALKTPMSVELGADDVVEWRPRRRGTGGGNRPRPWG